MITGEKLRIFVSYKGDGDMFARAGGTANRALMPDSDWHLIDLLLQDANVINRRLGSEERTAQAWGRLNQNCASETVVNEILRLAESGL